MIYYTSDHHFFHNNIIKYQNRPYYSVEEMNDDYINKWNSVIKPNDTIYYLGDFALGGARWERVKIFDSLKGIKHLIRGNHDDSKTLKLGWESIQDYKEIKDGGDWVILFHYPLRSWHWKEAGAYHLFGHTHGKMDVYGNSIDVGVDYPFWRGQPISLESIKNWIIQDE